MKLTISKSIISFQNHEQKSHRNQSEIINQNSTDLIERKIYAKHLMCSFHFGNLNRMKDSREPSELQEIAERKGARMHAGNAFYFRSSAHNTNNAKSIQQARAHIQKETETAREMKKKNQTNCSLWPECINY